MARLSKARKYNKDGHWIQMLAQGGGMVEYLMSHDRRGGGSDGPVKMRVAYTTFRRLERDYTMPPPQEQDSGPPKVVVNKDDLAILVRGSERRALGTQFHLALGRVRDALERMQ
jgi:hypothetical protein